MNKNQFSISALARLMVDTVAATARMTCRKDTVRQWPRMFHEGIDPLVHLFLQANNTALIDQWLDRGTKVVFLSSFPRSGNTWMRYLLSDVLLQMHGLKTTTRLPIHPDNLMPEFGTNCIARRIRRCPTLDLMGPPAAFIKSHFPFERHVDIFAREKDKHPRDCRILYLFRTPEDALVSFFHMCERQPWARGKTTQGLDAFCRVEAANWVKNVSSYFKAADEGYPVFFLSYEKLLENPAIVLENILRWLEIKHDDQMVPRAVSNMKFVKLQAMEMQESQFDFNSNERNLFFRRGCSGSGRTELPDSTLQEIHKLTGAIFDQANQRQASQPANHPASPGPDSRTPARSCENSASWNGHSTGSDLAA